MQKILAVLASKKLFWLIIILFILESAWIAMSFRYPMIYDEGFHFGVIQIFGHQLSPFINNQPPQYDTYKDLSHMGSLLYHYLMSFPYRVITSFTDSLEGQVVSLRIINVLMVALGLWIFARLFRKIGIKQIFINLALLFFILIPIVPFVSAHINYDNMLFPLTAWYLLLCVQLLKSKKVNWQIYAGLIAVGCAASLVKFTFLPIFAASIIYLAVVLYRRDGKKFFTKLLASLKKAQKSHLAIAAIVLTVFIGMFSAVYLQNVVRYGTPQPTCTKTMAKQRCLTNSTVRRNLKALEVKDQNPAKSLVGYTEEWFNAMLSGSIASAANTAKGAVPAQALPAMPMLMFFGIFLGLGVLIYAWRALRKNESWYFLLTMVVVLTAAVFLDNYHIYLTYHVGYAIQPRYLISILPIVLVMILMASNFILRKSRWLKVTFLAVILLVFIQGGGPVTHILRSDDTWYWKDSKVIKANHGAKKILKPFVKEYNN